MLMPPHVTTAEVSLAGATTLDARLLEQLAVLLLRHALATLFDHGSHGQPLSLKLKAWCTQVGAKFLAHRQGGQRGTLRCVDHGIQNRRTNSSGQASGAVPTCRHRIGENGAHTSGLQCGYGSRSGTTRARHLGSQDRRVLASCQQLSRTG